MPVGQFPVVELIIEEVKYLVREITIVGFAVMFKLCGLTVRLINRIILEYRIALAYNRLWLLLRSIGNGRFRCRFGGWFGCRTGLLRLFKMQLLPCLPNA